ncbi:hypothetical protein BJ508DRAFT_362561 [Ascobolus immersus RN42]|uniref:NACHT domain-containing protein n=1 Tax=Ascobolus immersus RN42 TaxID=1160509 RepID=A0A3N4I8P8_ASCIM|nr:hypothetical protein BJ508DRAFT_362561 [Ascobolus immersus RN42]
MSGGESDTGRLKELQNARDVFLLGLAPDERCQFANCSSAEEMLECVRTLPAFKRHSRSRLKRLMAPIERLSITLSPYFDIIGIVVSSRPEWAGVVWGSIRLVLKFASNYMSLFTKIGQLFDTLLKELPRFAEILEIIRQSKELQLLEQEKQEERSRLWPGSADSRTHRRSPFTTTDPDVYDRISDTIIAIYHWLMGMLQSVAGIFTHPDGSAKSSFRVLTGSVWRSFEERFSDWMEELRSHKAALADDLAVAQAKILTDECLARHAARKHESQAAQERVEVERIKQAERRRSHLLYSIQQWLSSPEFMKEHEAASGVRYEGTAEWLWDNKVFQHWRTCEEIGKGNILWVQGNAGAGKTTLCASIVDELKEEPDTDVFYFYFTAIAEKSTVESSLRAILAQALQQNPESIGLFEVFEMTMSSLLGGQRIASLKELLELFIFTFSKFLPKGHIILDGIDECEDFEKLIPAIQCLTSGCGSKNVWHVIYTAPRCRVHAI